MYIVFHRLKNKRLKPRFDSYEEARSYARKYIRKYIATYDSLWNGSNPALCDFGLTVRKV